MDVLLEDAVSFSVRSRVTCYLLFLALLFSLLFSRKTLQREALRDGNYDHRNGTEAKVSSCGKVVYNFGLFRRCSWTDIMDTPKVCNNPFPCLRCSCRVGGAYEDAGRM